MTWNAARDRAQAYRPRKPYKPVAPIGPQITGTFAASDGSIVRYEIDHRTWCDDAALSALMHKSTGDAYQDADMDESCRGCGYLRCSCKWQCQYCNEVVEQDHDQNACRRQLLPLIVESYVVRKTPIADWVAPYVVVYLLDEWSGSGARNDFAGMDEAHATWAKNWRMVRSSKHVNALEFKRGLNEYIALSNKGKTHLELLGHFLEQEARRQKEQPLTPAKLTSYAGPLQWTTGTTTDLSEVPF